MICRICKEEIGEREMRHSDGLGNTHIICEFNVDRERLGLPSFQSVRKTKFISGFAPNLLGREVEERIFHSKEPIKSVDLGRIIYSA